MSESVKLPSSPRERLPSEVQSKFAALDALCEDLMDLHDDMDGVLSPKNGMEDSSNSGLKINAETTLNLQEEEDDSTHEKIQILLENSLIDKKQPSSPIVGQ